MKYEEIEVETMFGKFNHIVLEMSDGSFKSFPADESNPEYVAFLEQLKLEKP
jgi:hypothetical protein